MREVLFVSKPVHPPWNDSSKNLVRDLATGLRRSRPIVMTRRGAPPPMDGVSTTAVYGAAAGGFSPALADNARVLGRLLFGARPSLWHFFFAPNRMSSRAGRFARTVRRVPVVHTVCSAPRRDVPLEAVLFADRTVVLSRRTERRFLEAGVPADRLARIAPAVPPLLPPDATRRRALRAELDVPEDAPALLFPGDLEVGEGARRCVEALAGLGRADAHLYMACRPKTARAAEVEGELRALAQRLGVAERVRWLGQTARIHDWLAIADLVALPSESLYAKMDYPLVLLEAMSLARPILVTTGTAAEELAEPLRGEGAGPAVAVEASTEALVSATRALLDDDSAREVLGERARRAASARFGLAVMADAYERLYDALLG